MKKFMLNKNKLLFLVIALILMLVMSACENAEDSSSIAAPSGVEDYKGLNYLTVQKAFEDAGFSTVELLPVEDLKVGLLAENGSVDVVTINGDSTFKKGKRFPIDAIVTISYHTYKSAPETEEVKPEEIEGTALTPGSAKDYEKKNYAVVADAFTAAGFANIETVPVYDLKVGLLAKDGQVKEVSVNGIDDFAKYDRFDADAKVTITYHAEGKTDSTAEEPEESETPQATPSEIPENSIAVPSSSNSYKKSNYVSVNTSLEDAGFTNITLKPIEDLKIGLMTKDGSVDAVMINGDSEFNEGDYFPADAKITITYHTYKSDSAESSSEAAEETADPNAEVSADQEQTADDISMDVSAPADAKDLRKKNYQEVEELFKDAGFSDIEFEELHDLKVGILTKDGAVEQVSIDDIDDFMAGDAFASDAKVVISYHVLDKDK